MPEDYTNTENREVIKRAKIRLQDYSKLKIYSDKLEMLLDKDDFERYEDNRIKLDDKGQKIPKIIKPIDTDVGRTMTDERRNEIWSQYKPLTEELLS